MRSRGLVPIFIFAGFAAIASAAGLVPPGGHALSARASSPELEEIPELDRSKRLVYSFTRRSGERERIAVMRFSGAMLFGRPGDEWSHFACLDPAEATRLAEDGVALSSLPSDRSHGRALNKLRRQRLLINGWTRSGIRTTLHTTVAGEGAELPRVVGDVLARLEDVREETRNERRPVGDRDLRGLC